MSGRLLVNLYEGMLLVRRVEEAIAKEYPKQEMRCPTHLCIGQEATPVGVCAALAPEDKVMSGHRSHGHYLAKGGNLGAMLAELYGRQAGCSGGKGGSMHLIDVACGFAGAVPIVSSTIPMAVGVAFGERLQGRNTVSVAFFGDAACEEGTFHEAVNFAALHKLPVLFVCENNLYSVYSHIRARQPGNRSLAHVAQGHGIRTMTGDGNDPVAVYHLTEKAVDHARSGEGPVFIETSTYRWLEHCGPNDDNRLGYRTVEEYEGWRAQDPLERMASRLLDVGTVTDADLQRMESTLAEKIAEAFAFAKASPYPESSEMLSLVYAGPGAIR